VTALLDHGPRTRHFRDRLRRGEGLTGPRLRIRVEPRQIVAAQGKSGHNRPFFTLKMPVNGHKIAFVRGSSHTAFGWGDAKARLLPRSSVHLLLSHSPIYLFAYSPAFFLFSASGCRIYCRFWMPLLVAVLQVQIIPRYNIAGLNRVSGCGFPLSPQHSVLSPQSCGLTKDQPRT